MYFYLDLTTLPPTLLLPASFDTIPSRFVLKFSLPEAPLSGKVKLNIDPTVLSSRVAGAHDLVIDVFDLVDISSVPEANVRTELDGDELETNPRVLSITTTPSGIEHIMERGTVYNITIS